MFQVDEYKVEFLHCQDVIVQSFTECVIWKGGFRVIAALAWLHPNDQYNRNTGRKTAMAKALKELTPDRQLRKRFWDAYFKARNGKH